MAMARQHSHANCATINWKTWLPWPSLFCHHWNHHSDENQPRWHVFHRLSFWKPFQRISFCGGFVECYSISSYCDFLYHWYESKWPWWRHQMETFSALLAICAGNSPVPVNSPHKGQWRGALMFTLICTRINGWVNNREAGDLRRYRAHYDVIVMTNKAFS